MHCTAQTMSGLKAHIVKTLKQIEIFADSTSPQITYDSDDSNHLRPHVWESKGNYRDSLERINKRFRKYLMATLPQVTESLSSDLNIPSDMTISTSADKKFRSWAWNTWTGGSMPDITLLIEYKTSKGIKVAWPNGGHDISDESPDTTYVLKSPQGMTYYLSVTEWPAEQRNFGKTIRAYVIADSGLVLDFKLFKAHDALTGKLELESNLSYSTEDWEDRNHIPDSFPGITLSADNHKLFLPHPDDSDRVVMDLYKFDGEHFVYKGVSK
jgi:hypothetical protein